jgi:WD40 repeat protein
MLINFRGFIMKKLLFLVFLLFFNSNSLFTGELTFGWNKVNEAGGIQDMKFMPDNNMFIVLAGEAGGSQVQIRSSETGDIISTYPIQFASFAKVEFTPDSTRFFITNGKFGKLELYNISNMQLIKSYQTLTDTMPLWFSNIAVDPHRPFIYATTYGEKGPNNGYIFRGQVSVYNYETMELVSHLTPFDGTIYNCLSVSRDGRYLAAISEGKSYLRIWDLNTMKLIREFRLYDPYCQDCLCKPKDMKFSEINTDHLYFSGSCLKTVDSYNGLLEYSVSLNNIVEDRYNNDGTIRFFFFDDEIRGFLVNFPTNIIFNFQSQEKEFEYTRHWPDVGTWGKVIYSKGLDFFIGWSGEYFSSGKYKRPSSVNNTSQQSQTTIYPNPTNGMVLIELPPRLILTSYQVSNMEGKIFDCLYEFDGIRKYTFNFSLFPVGTYIIQIICGKEKYTYKVIKEY